MATQRKPIKSLGENEVTSGVARSKKPAARKLRAAKPVETPIQKFQDEPNCRASDRIQGLLGLGTPEGEEEMRIRMMTDEQWRKEVSEDIGALAYGEPTNTEQLVVDTIIERFQTKFIPMYLEMISARSMRALLRDPDLGLTETDMAAAQKLTSGYFNRGTPRKLVPQERFTSRKAVEFDGVMFRGKSQEDPRVIAFFSSGVTLRHLTEEELQEIPDYVFESVIRDLHDAYLDLKKHMMNTWVIGLDDRYRETRSMLKAARTLTHPDAFSLLVEHAIENNVHAYIGFDEDEKSVFIIIPTFGLGNCVITSKKKTKVSISLEPNPVVFTKNWVDTILDNMAIDHE